MSVAWNREEHKAIPFQLPSREETVQACSRILQMKQIIIQQLGQALGSQT
jgi:hypothetical protein